VVSGGNLTFMANSFKNMVVLFAEDFLQQSTVSSVEPSGKVTKLKRCMLMLNVHGPSLCSFRKPLHHLDLIAYYDHAGTY
jgi:hypothetical protein